MKRPVIIIGVGEIGGVLARGLLKLGYPVYPANRNSDLDMLANKIPDPVLVLVAVGEKDLQACLETIPADWNTKIGLIQNELLPRDWQDHPFVDPTVVSVWFEKKPGQTAKVVVPSPVYGPQAQLLIDALATLELPAWRLDNETELVFQLVRKNLYILTTNIAGLEVGGNVEQLWQQHQQLAVSVVDDILKIQSKLTENELDRQALVVAMVAAFEGDPEHQCMGRGAPARLQRALQLAEKFRLSTPTLQSITKQQD